MSKLLFILGVVLLFGCQKYDFPDYIPMEEEKYEAEFIIQGLPTGDSLWIVRTDIRKAVMDISEKFVIKNNLPFSYTYPYKGRGQWVFYLKYERDGVEHTYGTWWWSK